jgi:serine/threonine-protein kinase
MMGVVYRALDPALGRVVALKTVSLLLAVPDEERAGFEQRFLNEARISAGLSHPNIVVVHDVGRDPGSDSLYIALEYLEGETLAQRVKRETRLDWREALRLTARVADALHHAHLRQIVHRDVKPANIMVLPSGEPKLMDFGIAKIPAAQLTSAGEFFGTPSYMSPEQAAGEELDSRSDVFSLGAVLYAMLTGVRAFDGPSVPSILARVAMKEPPAPSTVAPGVPAAVDEVVTRALAKDRTQRYATARMLAEDIEDVMAGRPPRHRVSAAPGVSAEGTISGLLLEPIPSGGEGPPSATAATRPPEPATSDLGAGGAAPVATAALGLEDHPVLRLADRVGRRGVVVLIALLAVGIAFPLAARRAPTDLPVPRPLTLPPPEPTPPPVEPSHLEIAFEHPLRSGTLRIYVDDAQVLEEALSGKVTKKILSVRLRKGSVKEVLDVAPGEHVIRVEVDGSGWDGSRRIRGTFKSGETRRLEATLDGLIKKDLTLVWGS